MFKPTRKKEIGLELLKMPLVGSGGMSVVLALRRQTWDCEVVVATMAHTESFQPAWTLAGDPAAKGKDTCSCYLFRSNTATCW